MINTYIRYNLISLLAAGLFLVGPSQTFAQTTSVIKKITPDAGLKLTESSATVTPEKWELPGSYSFSIADCNWADTQRNREVPVRIYLPQSDKPVPVIIFSHGLGGGRQGYAYLGKHWASHGYACVVVQHPGSDSELWREQPPAEAIRNMRQAANAENSVLRVGDIRFVHGKLVELNAQGGEYAGRFDMEKLGISGHSFGSQTTLASLNAGLPFKAAIPMSSPSVGGPLRKRLALEKIIAPCLHMTGTEDNSPIGETSAGQRREHFDYLNKSDQYLVTFNGGTHSIFSDYERPGINREKDEIFHRDILALSTAFWDYYLRDSQTAGTWLKEQAKTWLASDATWEIKLK